MEIKMHENIKSFREAKHMTQSEIAQQIGVTQQAYQYYESGKRQPSIETLIRLANIFETSIDILVGRYEKKL